MWLSFGQIVRKFKGEALSSPLGQLWVTRDNDVDVGKLNKGTCIPGSTNKWETA